MKRYVSLEEISDGKLYTVNDMVKTDCLDCRGCSKCCHGMGDTILLDPYDIWRLQQGLGKGMDELMAQGAIALRVVDGIILPHLAMIGREETCSFLDENGRCSIHFCRPGICRLFPLGRYYENGGFKYFLQTKECDHPKMKTKISKWLGTPDLPSYEQFNVRWHDLLMEAEELMAENPEGDFGKNFTMFFLKVFYLTPYDGMENFYTQFEERVQKYREIVRS